MSTTSIPLDPATRVAHNVRRVMRRRGITGVEMARRLDMTQSAWSRRETGHTPMTVDELIEVAAELAVDPGLLLRLDSNQEPPGLRVALAHAA